MAKHTHSDGLYRKVESPVVESVTQDDGLYKKVKVAKVTVANPTDAVTEKVKELESESAPTRRILNE